MAGRKRPRDGAAGQATVGPGRNVFTARRKGIYLDHFAATGDRAAAAAAAGISKSTVSSHRRSDPVFAEAHRQALALAYENLEAEAVRDRLAAMERIDTDPARAGAAPAEFDRTLQLLRDHKKTPAARTGAPPALCSFEEGFAALERELDALERRERGNGAFPPLDGEGQGGVASGDEQKPPRPETDPTPTQPPPSRGRGQAGNDPEPGDG